MHQRDDPIMCDTQVPSSECSISIERYEQVSAFLYICICAHERLVCVSGVSVHLNVHTKGGIV